MRKTEWLRSPISEKAQRLQPGAEVRFCPYAGRRRRIKIWKTEYTIGTDPSCDIRLHDPFASGVHARMRLAPDGGGFEVEDLDSKNGVLLNGVRVRRAFVPARGTLTFGRSMLRMEEDEAAGCYGGLLVADEGMRELLKRVRTAAAADVPILILGETGTGKEEIARLVHEWSGRVGAFVPFNAAMAGGSLAESELFGHTKGAFTGSQNARLGALRTAHNGTLFLDEVADIPPEAQVKLLRALEGGEVRALGSDRAETSRFRLVAATSQPLEGRVNEGSFRGDLFWRIAGFTVHIPPLRARPDDLEVLARKFASDRNLAWSDEAIAKVKTHSWPGNVRELRSAVDTAATRAQADGAQIISSEHLVLGRLLRPAVTAREGNDPALRLAELERRWILDALDRNAWSRSHTARQLGIARSTLHQKMDRYRIRSAIAP
ncbi:MAG: sigma 54-interacting transcriptional regulator [Bdellovibrionales bacterium]|nr:sigma 54-interacting transcriptional regulator [Bdellovibrionales bacterium]